MKYLTATPSKSHLAYPGGICGIQLWYDTSESLASGSIVIYLLKTTRPRVTKIFVKVGIS